MNLKSSVRDLHHSLPHQTTTQTKEEAVKGSEPSLGADDNNASGCSDDNRNVHSDEAAEVASVESTGAMISNATTANVNDKAAEGATEIGDNIQDSSKVEMTAAIMDEQKQIILETSNSIPELQVLDKQGLKRQGLDRGTPEEETDASAEENWKSAVSSPVEEELLIGKSGHEPNEKL